MPRVGSHVPTGLVAATHEGDHLVMREPGWFSVELPGKPRLTIEPDLMPRGAFEFKRMGLQTNDVLLVVNYVEFADENVARDAEHSVVARYEKNAVAGVHASRLTPVRVDDVDGRELSATVDPNSETNGASYPVTTRARILRQGGRFYQLQCTTRPDQTAMCDRFFGSFHFDGR